MKTLHSTSLLAIAIAIALVLGACAAHPPDDTNDDHAANACAACHRADFEEVKRPLHAGVKPTTCAVCHTQEAWRPSVLRHEWALTGAHAKVDCFACHAGTPSRFRGTGKECIDCHRKDAANVSFGDHAAFGSACAKCHTTNAWKPATGPAHEEALPPPEPQPTSSASTPPKDLPKTSPTKPRPKPVKPTPVPSTSASTKPPDVVTRPSRRVTGDSP